MYGKNIFYIYIYTFVCASLCVPVLKTILRNSQCKGKCAPLSMRLCSGAGRPEAVSHAEGHISFSPASLVLRHPKFWQWTSSFGPFCKVATWNNPEISNFPANSSIVLSQISRLQWGQMNTLSSLCFMEKFCSVHVTHSSSCWDNGKDKPTFACGETTITKHTENRNN